MVVMSDSALKKERACRDELPCVRGRASTEGERKGNEKRGESKRTATATLLASSSCARATSYTT